MSKFHKFCTLFATTLLVTGCASAPTQDQINAADYGASISQDDAVALATNYEKSKAKDPYSLKVECGQVYKGWTSNRFSSKSMVAGYLLDCSVNGKNSFGAYVGARKYRFVIHDGSVVKLLEQMDNGKYGPEGAVDAIRNMR